MKKYIVSICSFFDYEVKSFEIEAENEYEAVKKGMIEFSEKESYKKSELGIQNSEQYPKTIEELNNFYEEMDFAVIEVGSFVEKNNQ
jgi:hypothetical protein